MDDQFKSVVNQLESDLRLIDPGRLNRENSQKFKALKKAITDKLLDVSPKGTNTQVSSAASQIDRLVLVVKESVKEAYASNRS